MAATRTVKIKDVDIVMNFPEEHAANADKVLEMKAFKDWCATVDREFIIKAIHVQSIDMFGPRVGFLKFRAEATDKDGAVVPSIVFMRGAAVAVLFVIRCDKTYEQYTILTIQPRFPTGRYYFADIPAGMVDDKDSFVGVAAKEMKEETGIEVKTGDLIDLTELAADKDNVVGCKDYPGVYPSCGGCDEFLKLYVCRKTMMMSEVEKLKGKLTGVIAEGEKIKLKIISLHDLWHTGDAKALAALCLYENLMATGKIPEWTPSEGQTEEEKMRSTMRSRIGNFAVKSGTVLGMAPTQGGQPVAGSGAGQLSSPGGLVVVNNETLLVSDTGNNRILGFDKNGHVVFTYGSSGSGKDQLQRPIGLAAGDNGFIAVADSGNNRVVVIEMATKKSVEIIGLAQPCGVAFDVKGNLVVADTGNHQIKVYSPTSWALHKTIGSHGRKFTAETNVCFDSPQGVAVDLAGNYWVADTNNHRILRVNPDGKHLTTTGSTTGQPGLGLTQFNQPTAISVSARDRVYVVDKENSRILVFSTEGHYLDGRCGPRCGTPVYPSAAGAVNEALWDPKFSAVALAQDDILFVADLQGHMVVAF